MLAACFDWLSVAYQDKKKSKKSKKDKKDKDHKERRDHKEHKDRHEAPPSAGNGNSSRSARDSGSSSKHRQHDDAPAKVSQSSSRKQSIDSAEEDGEIIPGKGSGDPMEVEGPATKRQRVQSGDHDDREADDGSASRDLDGVAGGERNGVENGNGRL